MAVSNIRELYDEAWHELFDVVRQRNKLLRTLHMMAGLAMDMTPAGGMVIEFDVSKAEELVARIDELTPQISAAMQKVNSYAEKCGAPTVKWQNIPLRMAGL